MKVIYNPKMNKEKVRTYKVKCDCGAELEVEEEDIKIGTYGMGYVMCPCCQNEYYDEEWADIIKTYFQPKCALMGYCPENNAKCHRKPNKKS